MTTFTLSSTIAYLVVGFIFMTISARKGWMNQYDPAFFYWIGWPVVILYAFFQLMNAVFAQLNTILQNYVDGLKPKQIEN